MHHFWLWSTRLPQLLVDGDLLSKVNYVLIAAQAYWCRDVTAVSAASELKTTRHCLTTLTCLSRKNICQPPSQRINKYLSCKPCQRGRNGAHSSSQFSPSWNLDNLSRFEIWANSQMYVWSHAIVLRYLKHDLVNCKHVKDLSWIQFLASVLGDAQQ